MKNLNFRKIVLMIADIFIIITSGVLLNYILELFSGTSLSMQIFNGRLFYSAEASRNLLFYIVISLLSCTVMMFAFGSYSRLWRYFKLKDYAYCGAAMFLGFVIGYGILGMLGKIAAQNFYTSLFYRINSGRTAVPLYFQKTFLQLVEMGKEDSYERTLIVGAGRAARMILTEIENAKFDPNNPSHNVWPLCMVDDDTTKLHTRIDNVEIVGTCPEIPKICAENNITNIIVAIPSLEGEQKRKILDYCSNTQCKIKVIPYLSEILFGEGNQLITQAREIKIEDLLGRKPIEFDRRKISRFINGKTVMVTGGGGSIGSELVRQIAKYNPQKVIIVDIYENNAYDIQQELMLEYGSRLDLETIISSVRDYDKMKIVFEKYRPQIVFHAAAHKHVPLMETVPEEAVKNNIFGTYNVAQLANEYKTDKFVMISTDKAVNPTNVMGATKRACEMIIQYLSQKGGHTDYVTTRFGNVLGSNGSVIPLFRRQIESGSPVTVTHPDIIRYFMTIPEAVSLVLEAGAMAHGGEIFVLDMGAPVKITTLAENLIRMYGKVPYKDIPIKFTGLRPGEKLYEELLMNEEGLKSTANKKIFIGNQIEIDERELNRKLDSLRAAAEANDSDRTVELLSDLVPTFAHQTN